MKLKKKNTILILGASGYLGSWLVKSFNKRFNLILIQKKYKQYPLNIISLTIDNFFNSELRNRCFYKCIYCLQTKILLPLL